MCGVSLPSGWGPWFPWQTAARHCAPGSPVLKLHTPAGMWGAALPGQFLWHGVSLVVPKSVPHFL